MYKHVHIPPKIQEGAFLAPPTHQGHLVHVACVYRVHSETVEVTGWSKVPPLAMTEPGSDTGFLVLFPVLEMLVCTPQGRNMNHVLCSTQPHPKNTPLKVDTESVLRHIYIQDGINPHPVDTFAPSTSS